ncbi:deoxyribodipyrimidine photo-lyase [Ostreiculturibacter nitratireducens]|uniref:cryptochrome/photolyase family protein n=1 Tax=Ostreiculturibacter nitratireducens TaxID=3075226 RepID=UPI0031B62241
MSETNPDAPILLWFRRDLRLGDHPMIAEAVRTGRVLIPVFLHDEVVEGLGAAPKWRLGEAVGDFAARIGTVGSRLVLRRGRALPSLRALLAETGARDVWWSRAYDPESKARDTEIKAALKAEGFGARSFPGHLLFEPWEVATGQGEPYKVYSPYWRAVKGRDVPAPEPAPRELRAPEAWPASDRLDDWAMGQAMRRGASVLQKHAGVGEEVALQRLATFMRHRVGDYASRRDFPAAEATSGLSENLTYGEIGPRTVWHTGRRAFEEGARGAEHFLKELVWREFAWHLMHHFPQMARDNWRPDWNGFPWRADNEDAERWRRGMTGEPFVDAAMREMYVTGRMHNRARMIVASYLTKHLLTDWRVGLAWFEDCLTDWDPASNAMGWQWVAGSGPDAAPYFRIFNPETQAEKFDPVRVYRRAFIAEGQKDPPETALDFFAACPESWGLAPDQRYPRRRVELSEGRARALAAYDALRREAAAAN